jgi:hypothetical protein
MVFEFMPYGDLAEVLRRNSRQFWKPIPGLAKLTKVHCCLPVEWQNKFMKLNLDIEIVSIDFISEAHELSPTKSTSESLDHSWTQTYPTTSSNMTIISSTPAVT